jgi:hypothetical protein
MVINHASAAQIQHNREYEFSLEEAFACAASICSNSYYPAESKISENHVEHRAENHHDSFCKVFYPASPQHCQR